jgi:hypothetical protein
MDALLHFLGFCPDHLAHPTLWTLLAAGTGGVFALLRRLRGRPI